MHSFDNQRYTYKDGSNSSSFLSSQTSKLGQSQGYQSKGLMELMSYYITELGYEKVAELAERFVRQPVYSGNQIQYKMLQLQPIIDNYTTQQYDNLQLSFNFVDEAIDLYAVKGEEIHYFDDGIGVIKQKEKRLDKCYKKESKYVQTNVLVMQQNTSSYKYLSINKLENTILDLETQIRCHFSLHYPAQVLPLVAITDGASEIRGRIERALGKNVCIILDWYHLERKIWDQCSRLGFKKADKERHIGEILNYLWQGEVLNSLIYMDERMTTGRNLVQFSILEDLEAYILKHQTEIIDYRKRYLLGKCIGSGRGEKANDQIIATRQKHNGTSWSEQGSAAIATLKCLKLNNHWDAFWKAA